MDIGAPFPTAFASRGLNWAKVIIAFGSLFGIRLLLRNIVIFIDLLFSELLVYNPTPIHTPLLTTPLSVTPYWVPCSNSTIMKNLIINPISSDHKLLTTPLSVPP